MSLVTDVQAKLEKAGIVEDVVALGISLEEANTLSIPDIARRINHAKGIVAQYAADKEAETLNLNGAKLVELNEVDRFATDNGPVDEAVSDDIPSKKKSKATPVVPVVPVDGVVPIVPAGETA